MNISSVGSSMMSSTMQGMQRPSASQMAENLFSDIDSEGKGYIEKTDLVSAMSGLANSEDTLSSDEMFEMLDSDGDGKITQQEMTTAFEDIAAEMSVRMKGDMPPPPPPEGVEESAPSYTLAELTEMAESSDLALSDFFSQLAENFDEADADGDGAVSREEAMSFQENSSAIASASTVDIQLMQTISELMRTYGIAAGNDANEGSFSASA